MSWREILNAESCDFSDKSSTKDPFSHYCHKDREIEKIEGGGRLDFIGHLTEGEREYFANLVEFMESPKHGMDRETAEKKAAVIVAEYRSRKEQRIERKLT